MKKIAWLLSIVMVFSLVGAPGFATEAEVRESASGFYYVEASGEQVRLSSATNEFLTVDGLLFKDLNGNGALDVYEDWRVDTAARVQDLISQMTLQEKTGALGFGGITGSNGVVPSEVHTDEILYNEEFYLDTGVEGEISAFGGRMKASMVIQIQETGLVTYIAAMTGLPKEQLDLLNELQSIAEDSRLGIPLVFSGDRSYNTWGGMIDMPHYALGVAGDEELLYDLVSQYAKESVALGYHQVFHGYGNEIGSWYGDEVNNIVRMAVAETKAYDDNNFSSHSKHFIARGGRSSYSNSISPASLLDSWLVPWQAVVDAGTRWVMTNNSVGVTPGLQVYMDKDTLDILRVDLGYDGIIVLDWPLDANSVMNQTGITSDGIDVSTLSLAERYALILNAGVDMFSGYVNVPGTDLSLYEGIGFQRYFPDVVVEAVEQGYVTEERIDLSLTRIFTDRFDAGTFEDPYRDWEDALEVFASDAYKAEQFEIHSNEDINRARLDSVTEMEERVMVQSTVLFKNDGDLLPLAQGTKIYVDSSTAAIKEADTGALAVHGEVVEDMAAADVVVLHVTALDDAYEYMVEDAEEAGKPIVLIMEGSNSASGGEPRVFEAEHCDAILWQSYRNTPDHGTSTGEFYRYVQPDVTADMLFGVREPSGKTVFEIGRDYDDYLTSWYDLAYDIGADPYTRLYMAALVKQDPTAELPSNVGDVLYPVGFGMEYGKQANITFDTLVVPRSVGEYETVNAWTGNTEMVRRAGNAVQTAGEPFEIMFLAFNDGEDGYTNAEVYSGEDLVASKFVGVRGDDFIIVRMQINLDAGEHVITVGDLSAEIVVE